MLSKFRTIFYLETVAPMFVYIIIAHLLITFVPGALPFNFNSIIGYIVIFGAVISIFTISNIRFIFKNNMTLKEKLKNEAEEKDKKKLLVRYFRITQRSASGIQIIGLAIFLYTGDMLPLILFSILSIPLMIFLYKNNIALVKEYFNE